MLALGVLAGVGGGGAAFVAVVSLASRAFDRNRTLALGVVQSGISLGGIAGPALVVPLIHTVG